MAIERGAFELLPVRETTPLFEYLPRALLRPQRAGRVARWGYPYQRGTLYSWWRPSEKDNRKTWFTTRAQAAQAAYK